MVEWVIPVPVAVREDAGSGGPTFSPTDVSSLFGWMWAGDNQENLSTFTGINGKPHYRSATNLASPGTNDFYNNNDTYPADGYLPVSQPGFTSDTGWSTSYYTVAVDDYQPNPGAAGVYGQHMYQAPMNASGQFYLASVVASVRGAGVRYMWGTDTNDYVKIDQRSGNQSFHIKIAGGTETRLTADGAFNTDDVMIVEIWRDASNNLFCRINGQDKTTGSPSASGTFAMNGWGGPYGDEDNGWDDYAFEFLCCNGATTAVERDNIKGYLNARWATYDPLSLPLATASSSLFTYQGAFLLPQGYTAGGNDILYGMPQLGAMCYNPSNDSLFIVCRGNSSQESMVESSIPTPKTSNYNTAAFLAGPVEACGGNQNLIVEPGENGAACAGIQIHNGRLVIFLVSRYLNGSKDGAETPQTSCCFVHDSLNIDTSNVSGPYTLGPYSAADLQASHTRCNRIYGGAGGDLTTQWQSVFGDYKSWMGGGGAQSIVGHHTSNGPQYVFLNPDSITGSTNSNVTDLTHAVEYQNINTLGGFDEVPYSTMVTGMSTWKASYFSEEYRTAITYGRHGDCKYRGDLNPKGNYAEVQAGDRFWFHDIQDIKNSFDGITAVDASTPYATLDLDFCTTNSDIPMQESVKRMACFDTVNKRLFVLEGKAISSNYPLVHVLSVNF